MSTKEYELIVEIVRCLEVVLGKNDSDDISADVQQALAAAYALERLILERGGR